MKRKKEENMQTMPKEIDGERYYSMEEAAQFLAYTRTQTQSLITRYEQEIGRSVRIKDAQYRRIAEKDLHAILQQHKPTDLLDTKEKYYTLQEAAAYLGYAYQHVRAVIEEYEYEVGHSVKIPYGRSKVVKESDLQAILIQRKPFEARKRGLIKE